jgi:hypothetical protein
LQINVCQNGIFKGNEALDRETMELDMKREELEQWALAAKQKEEDNQALSKHVDLMPDSACMVVDFSLRTDTHNKTLARSRV